MINRSLIWLLAFGGALASTQALPASRQSLAPLEAKLASQFSEIRHIAPEELESMIAIDRGSVLLLDVREVEEYAVSQLPGARRVDPGSTVDSFMSEIGDVAGKTAVFYCSVEYRSSKLATATRAALVAKGAKGVANLRGGIFAWRNTQRPLFSDGRKTNFVHPYSRSWGGYLEFEDLAHTTPAASEGPQN